MTENLAAEGASRQGAPLLDSPVRRAITEALSAPPPTSGQGTPAAPGWTAGLLADVVGLHVTTVRFHLDQLVASGLVTAKFTREFGVGRPRKVYALAAGDPLTTGSSEALPLLAGLLAESFESGASPEEAGERWVLRHLDLEDSGPAGSISEWLTKVGRLIGVLHEWGYSPVMSTEQGGRVCNLELSHCPFLDLARANRAVVCGVHKGLLAGAMHEMGERQVDVSLQPFVGPDACRAQITTHTPFHRPVPQSRGES